MAPMPSPPTPPPYSADAILLGAADVPPSLRLSRANRHGLIAGATGTGKTVSLQVLVEGFSQRGVPAFVADVKGDLAGLSRAGEKSPRLMERAASVGIRDFTPHAFPVTFWDLFGESGHPIRTTVSEMGPVLLSRLLELNDPQEGALNIAFRVADEEGLLLLDLKDLRAMLNHIGERSAELSLKYGNVNKGSVGAIQRRLLVLDQQGAEAFFGEPALAITDFLRQDADGRGVVNILAADRLVESPRLYGTFLLWLLSELFEELPEVGDVDAPKLVFFFDEAHLLFDDAPKALLDKVAQVVRLVRSKGVGVFFISQNPLDIPQDVLGQLGNRIQHALRAFTPADQRAVRAAANTFRPNPAFKVERAITELGVGEALVSVLDAAGTPTVVQRTRMRPPVSRMGPVTREERVQTIADSPLIGRYEETVDRESAYEILAARRAEPVTAPSQRAASESGEGGRGRRGRGGSRKGHSFGSGVAQTMGREVGRQVSRSIIRGLLGSILK